MNIESILYKINLFKNLVINSGFKRNIDDFIQSIQQVQNQNIVFMQGLSTKIIDSFKVFEKNSLKSELGYVLRDSNSFTDIGTVEELKELEANTEIDGQVYFQRFNQALNKLKKAINANETEIATVEVVFLKYVTNRDDYPSEAEQALVSLVFKDLKSTGNLLDFSKVLHRWNRTLTLYYGLLKSVPLEEISLVEVQNGSIDIVFNIDVDVAIDLAELMKVGLQVYGAYLLYKSKKAREIIDSYMGNRRLIAMEVERENLMLANIHDSMKKKAIEQHKLRLKTDKAIDKVSHTKKADEISSVIADHIVKGNEIKLLQTFDGTNEDDKDENDISTELREQTAIVRERFKILPDKEKKLLLDKYSIKEEADT